MASADSMPTARISREPISTFPASAMQGRTASAATCATPYGTLPEREEKSNAPSPVMTRSARRARSARPTTSATRAMPGLRVAPSSISPNPSPPAAPAPLASASFLSVASASRSRTASTACRRSSVTPFCGP